jgi:hypothetical protein
VEHRPFVRGKFENPFGQVGVGKHRATTTDLHPHKKRPRELKDDRRSWLVEEAFQDAGGGEL